MVWEEGLEPSRPKAVDFKSTAYTYSAIPTIGFRSRVRTYDVGVKVPCLTDLAIRKLTIIDDELQQDGNLQQQPCSVYPAE